MNDGEEMNDGVDAVDVDDEASSSSRDGLLYTLVHRLQVYRPVLVLRKRLVRSYLSRYQNYLAIAQAEYDRGFRRRGVLTVEEHDRVHGAGGLELGALDRRGRSYNMVLGGLPKTYRLRKEWGRFLRNTGVRQDDDRHVGDVIELWAFRSPAWDTELGLVLLNYTKEEDAQMMMAIMPSIATGGWHRQVQRFALPSSLTEEKDEEEEITMAAVTLMCMKHY